MEYEKKKRFILPFSARKSSQVEAGVGLALGLFGHRFRARRLRVFKPKKKKKNCVSFVQKVFK